MVGSMFVEIACWSPLCGKTLDFIEPLLVMGGAAVYALLNFLTCTKTELSCSCGFLSPLLA